MSQPPHALETLREYFHLGIPVIRAWTYTFDLATLEFTAFTREQGIDVPQRTLKAVYAGRAKHVDKLRYTACYDDIECNFDIELWLRDNNATPTPYASALIATVSVAMHLGIQTACWTDNIHVKEQDKRWWFIKVGKYHTYVIHGHINDRVCETSPYPDVDVEA